MAEHLRQEMYGQSQCHYHDQKNGGGNNYRLTHGVIVAVDPNQVSD